MSKILRWRQDLYVVGPIRWIGNPRDLSRCRTRSLRRRSNSNWRRSRSRVEVPKRSSGSVGTSPGFRPGERGSWPCPEPDSASRWQPTTIPFQNRAGLIRALSPSRNRFCCSATISRIRRLAEEWPGTNQWRTGEVGERFHPVASGGAVGLWRSLSIRIPLRQLQNWAYSIEPTRCSMGVGDP